MSGKERREKIIRVLTDSTVTISGKELAEAFGVSRQLIVTDIALLRAQNHEISSTNQGYLLVQNERTSRVFKVIHSDEDTEAEMNLIVDLGGNLEDVFVYHKVYGTVHAELNIHSRLDVQNFLHSLSVGKSGYLKNVTEGFHYHTVTAASEALLDIIQEQLRQKGFLAQLQDYEPINFWEEKHG